MGSGVIKKETNIEHILFLKDLTTDSFVANINCFNNTFSIFKSICGIFYLIYSNKKSSIISYDLINNKTINIIKKAHKSYIINFRHILDNFNKRDLIISLSCDNNKKNGISKILSVY